MRKSDRPLSRESILAKALELVDGEGIKALTMRGLGHALCIKAMSIYHYFKNREELLDGIVEIIMQEVGSHANASRRQNEDWEAVARRIVSAYRVVGKRHPNAFQLFARRPLRTKAAIAQGQELVDAFLSLELDRTQAVIAYRAISCFTAGFVLLETSNGKPAFSTGNFNMEFNGGLDVILSGIPAVLLKAKAAKTRKK